MHIWIKKSMSIFYIYLLFSSQTHLSCADLIDAAGRKQINCDLIESSEMYLAALDKCGDGPFIRTRLGVNYYLLGNKDESENQFNIAIRLAEESGNGARSELIREEFREIRDMGEGGNPCSS